MKKLFAIVNTLLLTVAAVAQSGPDASLDVNVTNTGGSNIPWLWILAGIALLVLLVAVLGRGRDRVIEK